MLQEKGKITYVRQQSTIYYTKEKIQGVTGRTSIPALSLVLTIYILALTSMSFRDFPFL